MTTTKVDYIKRFQSRLNKFDSIPKQDRSREGIILHLDILGYTDPAIAEKDGNKKNLTVLNDINERDAYNLLLTELQGDVSDLAVQDDIIDTERLAVLEEVRKGLEPSNSVNTVNNGSTLSLVLSQEEKQILIQQQAQNFNVTLVSSEVKNIAINMASEFKNMSDVLRVISEHLQAYTVKIAAENERIIIDGINQSRNTLNESANRVTGVMSDFALEAQQRSLDFKSLANSLTDILSIA
jgi:hypothetical protein